MAARKKEERIRNTCYICNGLKFPFGPYLQFLTNEMVHHLTDNHLPLKCDKCSIVFETAEDFMNVENCCKPKISSIKAHVDDKENMGIITQPNDQEVSLMPLKQREDFEKVLTPLTKINMRWRRKSKEFPKLDDQVLTEEEKRRQTSTPMIKNVLATKYFTDSSSIHLSSINFTNSSSGESGEFSPSLPIPTKEVVIVKTPPSLQNNKSANRSRGKLPVQATPLQQVMTKSIQRAYQQHGDYRQTPFNLQKRRVSFNSTKSSSEGSIMKFIGSAESQFDLRLSPALMPFKEVPSAEETEIDSTQHSPNELMNLSNHIEFEQIQVIISRGKIMTDSSTMSNYKSCWSDSDLGRSGSIPDIDYTPKIIGNHLLKKTISFEPPGTIDKTPTFLMPHASKVPDQDYLDDDDDDNDVFYTPCSTPIRPRRPAEIVIPIDSDEESQTQDSSKPRNIWNFVSNVIKIAARKSEDIGESLNINENLWNFKKPEFVKKATEYFRKQSVNLSEQEQPLKRRRTSSGTDSRNGSLSSPVLKRQKIQSRKPIERMRKLS